MTSGQFIGKRYRIIEFIGSGAFGTTYLAVDTRRPGNPTCVVKQLLPTPKMGKNLKNAKMRFSREAKILEKLGKHPNIPQLFAYFEENKQLYLVEEYIPGYPLTSELTLGCKLSEVTTINLIKEILEILAFIHANGVIHRDIKPSNIIRRQPDGKLFLIDFGAVKEINQNHVSSQTITMATGTPAYMPIEQFQGNPKPNSDIYAVGMIAIQALTGVHPKELPMIKNLDHVNSGSFYWKELVKVSPEFTNIIDKMVADDYHVRYQSAKEVLADLQQIYPLSSNLGGKDKQITTKTTTDLMSNDSTLQESQANLPNFSHRFKARIISFNSLYLFCQKIPNFKFIKFIWFMPLIIIGSISLLLINNNLEKLRAKMFYNQAIEKARNGENEAAIAYLNKAIKLVPQYKSAYYSRGRIRFLMGDYLGSIEDYSQTIKLNPQDAGAYANRCVSHLKLSDFTAAVADCSEAIKINPQYVDALTNRCLALISIGDTTASLADCNQALALNSTQYDAYYGRGLIYHKLGELNLAIADYTQAIAHNPNLAAAYYYRGLAKMELNHRQNAESDLHKAAELCQLPTIKCDIDPQGELEKYRKLNTEKPETGFELHN